MSAWSRSIQASIHRDRAGCGRIRFACSQGPRRASVGSCTLRSEYWPGLSVMWATRRSSAGCRSAARSARSAGAEPSRGRRGRLASPTSASRRQAARARRRGPRRAGHRSLAGLPRCACRPRRHGESDRGGPKDWSAGTGLNRRHQDLQSTAGREVLSASDVIAEDSRPWPRPSASLTTDEHRSLRIERA